jgi:hypothetical protein
MCARYFFAARCTQPAGMVKKRMMSFVDSFYYYLSKVICQFPSRSLPLLCVEAIFFFVSHRHSCCYSIAMFLSQAVKQFAAIL